MYYTNKRGERVEVELTKHAFERFEERYRLLFGSNNKDTLTDLEIRFNNSSRVTKFTPKDKRRLKKYGKDTMFFRNLSFTFVVMNRKVVTIEISRKSCRYLNKVKN